MTTRNLEALFAPRTIALIGASDRPGSVGAVLAENLLAGGYAGEVMLVNPRGISIAGRTTYRSVAELPARPDLAVIATPAAIIPRLVSQLGERGCRAAVVISAGFEGDAAETVALRQALLDAARPHLLRIVGPNCLGVLSPAAGVNASFAIGEPPAGNLALVAQSGAVAAAALDWAPSQGLGFSQVVTLGDSLDVDVGDLLDMLARDPATQAILLYVESLSDGRKFMSAARLAAREKPVVVIKGGRSPAGAKAAFSHTGALAGADAVYEAAFRRAGVLQAESLEQFLEAAATLGRIPATPAGRLAILTNGGGAGVLAVDAMARVGGRLAELSAETLAALEPRAPARWSRGNPVDILGDAQAEHYAGTLAALLEAPEADAVLVINCPTAVADSGAAAAAVIRAVGAQSRSKPVLTCWLGGAAVEDARRKLAAAGLPTFATPEAAVRAAAMLEAVARLHAQLLEAPDGLEGVGDAPRARAPISRAIAEGRSALTPAEVGEVLASYGIPTLAARIVRSPAEAAEAAAAIGAPVALKILSPGISHKSDVGGVQLNLADPQAVADAAGQMLDRVRQLRPDAVIEGFLVQPMLLRPKAHDVLAGVVQDPTFGPVVMVGHGGVAVEAVADRALGLPPLNTTLARDMIGRTRVSRLLAGYRDRPPADLDALAGILVALGRLATELPEIAELDLNPILCDDSGALVVDARIGVRRPDARTPRPAILPYPAHLTHTVELGGERLTIRAVRPGDRARLMEMVDRSSPLDVQLRFCGGLLHLSPDLATRLSQLDYDRQMALVAEDASGALIGVGRLAEDPEGESGEFALMVRSDRQSRGLGRLLLRAVLDYAATRGLREVWGDVARENGRMLTMSRAFGFEAQPSEGDPARLRVCKRLPAQAAPGAAPP